MTRGVLEIDGAKVEITMGPAFSGDLVWAVVLLELKDAGGSARVEQFRAPTYREAWASLATWIGVQLEEVRHGG